MDIQTLDKETMDAMKGLLKVNQEFSEAKVTLNAIKEEIGVFLSDRDKKDKLRLDALLKESANTVEEIRNNHAQVNAFLNEVKTFSVFLNEFYAFISESIVDFNKDSNEFMELVKREEQKLHDIQEDIKKQLLYISSENKNIEKEHKQIEKEKRLIQSRQEQIKSALQVLKNRQ